MVAVRIVIWSLEFVLCSVQLAKVVVLSFEATGLKEWIAVSVLHQFGQRGQNSKTDTESMPMFVESLADRVHINSF